MTPYFTELIKILIEDEKTYGESTISLLDRMEEFEKTDIYKNQIKENLEFENKKFMGVEGITLEKVVAVECRSKQHLNKCAKVFMPR